MKMTSRSPGKFSEVKDAYHKLTMEMLSDRKLLKDTGAGTYTAAACSTIHDLFKKIGLGRYRNFCDLGSGDGRVVAVASTFTMATGIEHDSELIRASTGMVERLDLSHCRFIEGDYLLEDLDRFDVLFINPDAPLYKLEKKLRSTGYKGKLIVFNPLYEPMNMKKKDEFIIDMIRIGVYEV